MGFRPNSPVEDAKGYLKYSSNNSTSPPFLSRRPDDPVLGSLPLLDKVKDILVNFSLMSMAKKVHTILENLQFSVGRIGKELNFLLRICCTENNIGGALYS